MNRGERYFATLKKIANYGLLIGICALAPLGAQSAEAQSIYDEAYQITNRVEVSNDTLGCNEDISLTWSTFITDTNKWHSGNNATEMQQVKESYETAVANGRWGVTQQNKGTDDQRVSVYWTEDTSLSLTWYTDGVLASGVNYVTIMCSGDGVADPIAPYVMTWSDMQNKQQAGVFISYIGANYYNLFVYTDYPNIPADYQGTTVIDEYTAPIAVEDMTAEMTVGVKVTGKEIQFWNTTPTPPITINDRCQFILYEADGITEIWSTEYAALCSTVHTVNVSDFESYVLQLTVLRDITGDGLPDEPTGMFTTVVQVKGTNYEMTAGSNWNDITDGVLMSECIVEDENFISITGCIENIKYVGTILSFDTIKFGETWSPNDQCRQLTVLDDWLGLPDVTVCPEIPSEIRNIVTPFITLALGLTVITFIAKKAGNDVL